MPSNFLAIHTVDRSVHEIILKLVYILLYYLKMSCVRIIFKILYTLITWCAIMLLCFMPFYFPESVTSDTCLKASPAERAVYAVKHRQAISSVWSNRLSWYAMVILPLSLQNYEDIWLYIQLSCAPEAEGKTKIVCSLADPASQDWTCAYLMNVVILYAILKIKRLPSWYILYPRSHLISIIQLLRVSLCRCCKIDINQDVEVSLHWLKQHTFVLCMIRALCTVAVMQIKLSSKANHQMHKSGYWSSSSVKASL